METSAPCSTSLAPVLTLKTTAPLCLVKGADVSKLLTRVEWVEIAGVEKNGSTVFYVIDIYLAKDQSRLPGTATVARSTGLAKPTQAEPDYRVRRRFSEFSQLFSDLLSVVQYSHKHYCHMCNEIRSMLVFTPFRALIATRTLFASTAIRQHVLTRFLCGVITKFVSTAPLVPRRGACHGSQKIPLMLNEFLFGKEQEP